MQSSRQELNTVPQRISQIADVPVLGVTKKPKRKLIEPELKYQQAENPDLTALDKAFDILFEETLRQTGNLTSYDN